MQVGDQHTEAMSAASISQFRREEPAALARGSIRASTDAAARRMVPDPRDAMWGDEGSSSDFRVRPS